MPSKTKKKDSDRHVRFTISTHPKVKKRIQKIADSSNKTISAVVAEKFPHKGKP